MTDTAVDLAFLLGNLSNAEESMRLILGDAFTFIPEEAEDNDSDCDNQVSLPPGQLNTRPESITTKESATIDEEEPEKGGSARNRNREKLYNDKNEQPDMEESDLPTLTLDFEESDCFDVPYKMADTGKAGGGVNANLDLFSKSDNKEDGEAPEGASSTNLMSEGRRDHGIDGDAIRLTMGKDSATHSEVRIPGIDNNDAPNPFSFLINDVIVSSSGSASAEEPFPPIAMMPATRKEDNVHFHLSIDAPGGEGEKGESAASFGNYNASTNKDHETAFTFVGSIYLPTEFSAKQSHQAQSSSVGSLIRGPFLPKEVFAPTPYLEPSDFAPGSFTSKSAGGFTSAYPPQNGSLSPGWSTGRSATTQMASSRVMSFQKAQCFKTRQCRFWLDGRCTRGDDCTFAHCGTELREKPNLIKTKICSKWKLGHCSKQQQECSYAHGLEDLRVLPSAAGGGAASPKPQVAYNADFGF